ncbi:solute carrier family 22 member 6-like [Cloeon dipterum]|uniref:solute carrier family 22 member 6-like n=1 Tax=Cloeon dipterum TaxID=197152 RepID=UPI00321FDFA0
MSESNGPAAAETISSEDADGCGPRQWRTTALLSLFLLPSTWHLTVITFNTVSPPFKCVSSPNITSCRADNETFCTKWRFDVTQSNTIISEWDLICENEYLISLAKLAFLLGVGLGGIISGILSDRLGRRKILTIALTAQILISTTIAFAPTLLVYNVLRFALGWSCVSVIITSFVLCMESVADRTMAGILFHVTVPLGYLTLAGLAFLLRNWRHLQLAITFPTLLLYGVIYVVPESPQWLRSDASQAQPLALVRTPRMRTVSALIWLLWLVVYIGYFGIVLNMGSIAGDIYLNTLFAGLMELVAIILSLPLLQKIGRRFTFICVLAAGGLCSACAGALIASTFSTVLVVLARSCLSIAYVGLPLYTSELFPTVVRNIGVGFSNFFAGLALVLVSHLWELAALAEGLPLFAVGALAALGAASVLFLPETLNKKLQDTVEEFEAEAKRSEG